ncbi:MAG: Rpn family recombination-promoting nuclease/putative transposase [Verrucomicrobia bacterium]|nr:Rpn family recombination-promoting nuclease/putative transposase [Cytophagales bacterium]
MQFADVKNDIAFRKIFGNENRKQSLISFLNAILAFEGEQTIVSVSILNPYQLPKLKGGKVTIIDVKATDQKGSTYLVEMQVAELDGFGKRVLYYFAKSYSEQIKRGDFYRQLKPVIFIGILDFVYTNNPSYISRNQVRDVETNERTLQDVEFNFIELPKFNKGLEDLQTLPDKWIYFIKNAENLGVIPENTDDEGLKIAYQEANKQTWTAEELEAYDYVYMREEDERAKLDAAISKAVKVAVNEAVEVAVIATAREGKIEMAKNMLAAGEPDEKIVSYTGLTLAEVQQIRTEA